MASVLPKRQMTEEDIKLQFITPALEEKWTKDRITMETKMNTRLVLMIRNILRLSHKNGQIYRGGMMMGLFGNILKGLLSDSTSSRQRRTYEPPRRYTPEEYVIYEQEQSGETWHGVPLCELSRLAQNTYRGRYCKVDQYGFLVFHYASNSKKHVFLPSVNLMKMEG